MINRLLQKFIKPLSFQRREEVVAEIRPLASPGFDFFLLVILSGSIATLGLLTDSPAVIIGAMLVAPLMSPIIAIGVASITGDTHLLKSAASAVLRGALLAVALSTLITLINNHLPILNLQSLPQEVISRTRPTPIDLVIALAGGLAASYALTQPNLSAALPGVAIATALMPPLCTVGIGVAMGRWEITGGALLLFITNAVTIAFAAVLVFFLRGFASSPRTGEHRLPGSLILSAVLTVVLLIPLTYFSLIFFSNAADNRQVNLAVQRQIAALGNAELTELNLLRNGSALDLNLTIRTTRLLDYQQVVAIQQNIVDELNRPVSLKINQIFAERLDPLVPPTATLTPTPTQTFTPGPSPTATSTPTATRTATATATITPSPTATATATASPTATPTPQQGEVVPAELPELRLYQSPGGPEIGALKPGQRLTVLYGQALYGGLMWVQVRDEEGRIGWMPTLYLRLVEPSPTPTASTMPSAAPNPASSAKNTPTGTSSPVP